MRKNFVNHLPASKSLSARALLVQALCEERFEIENLSTAQDTEFLAKILKETHQERDTVFVGEGGTTLRFFLAYATLKAKKITLEGTERLNQRPIAELVEALRQLGANLTYTEKEGCAPIKIEGFEQKNNKIQINGGISSQFVSALMLIAPCLPMGMELTVKKPIVSRSYIELTQSVLDFFGVKTKIQEAQQQLSISIKKQSFVAKNYRVEKDWSSASYWYSVVALQPPGTSLFLPDLDLQSRQADRAMADFGRMFGIESKAEEHGIFINKKYNFKPDFFQADCLECPDLAQTLAFMCTALKVPFRLTGLSTLTEKETNRIAALQSELPKLGAVNMAADEDSIKVDGYIHPNKNIEIQTFGDHRMVMAAAPLSLVYELNIQNPELVKKSYPLFWEDFRQSSNGLNQ